MDGALALTVKIVGLLKCDNDFRLHSLLSDAVRLLQYIQNNGKPDESQRRLDILKKNFKELKPDILDNIANMRSRLMMQQKSESPPQKSKKEHKVSIKVDLTGEIRALLDDIYTVASDDRHPDDVKKILLGVMEGGVCLIESATKTGHNPDAVGKLYEKYCSLKCQFNDVKKIIAHIEHKK